MNKKYHLSRAFGTFTPGTRYNFRWQRIFQQFYATILKSLSYFKGIQFEVLNIFFFKSKTNTAFMLASCDKVNKGKQKIHK